MLTVDDLLVECQKNGWSFTAMWIKRTIMRIKAKEVGKDGLTPWQRKQLEKDNHV